MFTGLVQAIGRIEQVEPRERGLHLVVQASPIDSSHLRVGDSVAVSGCCLTATSVQGTRFQVDVSEETLARTANLDRCADVNLELSLALGDRIGGTFHRSASRASWWCALPDRWPLTWRSRGRLRSTESA